MSLYQAELMDHYKNPRNRGELKDPDFTFSDENPSCGDKICIQGQVKDGVLNNIKFTGNGCVLSQASASIITEECKNKTVDEVLSLSREYVLDLVGLELGPVRIKCAMLPLLVFKEGLKSLNSK